MSIEMTINGQNFIMHQGDTKELHIVITDDATGLPLDLSPYIAGGTITYVAYRRTNKDAIITKTYGSGITVPAPATGEVIVLLSPTDTENIVPNVYNHECEITSSPANVSTVMTGTIEILYSKA